MITQYNIDTDRVYVVGISAGGAMTTIMGATYPDLYSAIGVHSGLEFKAADNSWAARAAQTDGRPDPDKQGYLAFLSAREEARVLPIIVFHGAKDEEVDAINAHQTLSQWAQTNDYSYDGSNNDSITDEAADAFREQTLEGYDYVRHVYENPEGEVIMEKWVVEEMGHAWAGGDPGDSYIDPEGPDASEEIICFRKSHLSVRQTQERARVSKRLTTLRVHLLHQRYTNPPATRPRTRTRNDEQSLRQFSLTKPNPHNNQLLGRIPASKSGRT